jgi:diphthamide synthase (EF-2-diphthine--ammonia ligase)
MRNTRGMAEEMVAMGLQAVVTAVDSRRLPRSFAGRPFDAAFLADLPPGVDPCGENGEFHTFVYHGPIFARPVPIEAGEVVERDGFWFADQRLVTS